MLSPFSHLVFLIPNNLPPRHFTSGDNFYHSGNRDSRTTIDLINPRAIRYGHSCMYYNSRKSPSSQKHSLSIENAMSCLTVNKLWRDFVGSQDFFWKKACLQFGLPEYVIEEHIQNKKCCKSLVDLFLATRRQRLYISKSSGVFLRIHFLSFVSCTSVSNFKCNIMSHFFTSFW